MYITQSSSNLFSKNKLSWKVFISSLKSFSEEKTKKRVIEWSLEIRHQVEHRIVATNYIFSRDGNLLPL